MIELNKLIRDKNLSLIELELLKKLSRPKRQDIIQFASQTAFLESIIADFLIMNNRTNDAVVNLISAASCLTDCNRLAEAKRIFYKAQNLCDNRSLIKWITSELDRYKSIKLPASIFSTGKPNIIENTLLREPQIASYLAAVDHFSRSNEHAIIQLPVGCGKTGTMSILPFNISNGRALVIAPNLEIANNLSKNFDYTHSDSFFRKTKILTNGRGPSSSLLSEDANIFDCDIADFVVTNIQQLVASNNEKWLSRFVSDYFDMILIDEGHHNIAPSWQNTLGRFPQAKITSFTATPLRSDGQKVQGKRIYRFPITDAIKLGYIKDIASRRLDPLEIYFEYKGQKRKHSLEEVMALREEEWFSRGIALSPECNRNIVDASIQCMKELRDGSDVKHQIIAAACSIDHAKAIRSLYNERNCRAEVLHSKLKEEEQKEIRRLLENGEIDVIVHIQMLGEGADYPKLGVAAIFRPFRHLVPYVQFIGRIMRVTKQNHPGHPDNRGYIISHVGLNVDRWWDELKMLDKDDQEFYEKIAQGNKTFITSTQSKEMEILPRKLFINEMQVYKEIIEHFVENQFLPEDSKVLVDDVILALELRGINIETLGISRESLEKNILDEFTNQGKVKKFSNLPIQPQKERQEAKRRLDERVKSAAKQLLNALNLRAIGWELPKKFSKLGSSNNLSAAIILLNIEVQEYLGINSDERHLLTVDELKKAHDNIDKIIDQVINKIKLSS